MHERQRLFRRPSDFEHHIDKLIREGEHFAADSLLSDYLEDMKREQRGTYVRLALKKVALPLYELVKYGATEERRERALDVYSEAAMLLQDELGFLSSPHSNSFELRESKGRVSELTVFSLLARDLHSSDNAPILLPTSREDDMADRAGRGVDFHLATLQTTVTDLYSVQVKTFLQPHHRELFAPHINLIGMNELDEGYSGMEVLLPGSLPNTMLRELAGTATQEDIDRLDEATLQFYDMITTRIRDGFVEHPTKAGWVQPAPARSAPHFGRAALA